MDRPENSSLAETPGHRTHGVGKGDSFLIGNQLFKNKRHGRIISAVKRKETAGEHEEVVTIRKPDCTLRPGATPRLLFSPALFSLTRSEKSRGDKI